MRITDEIAHSIAPHDASDPLVTWSVFASGSIDLLVEGVRSSRIAGGVPSFDAALAIARDHFGPIETLLDATTDTIIDDQRVAFVPFVIAGSEHVRAAGVIMPELRCRACRRTL